MDTTVVILGAEDPEMKAIRKFYAAIGIPTYDATIKGVRVNPRTAYTMVRGTDYPGYVRGRDLILVECGTSLPHQPADGEYIFDHHLRPPSPQPAHGELRS